MATAGVPRDQYSVDLASDDFTDTDWCRLCDILGTKIEWYCVDHSTVFCVMCKYTGHSSCKDVKFIPEFVKGVEQVPYFIKTKTDLDKVESDIAEILSYMKHTKSCIVDGCTSIIDDLRKYRERVISSFDMLEERIIEEVQKFQDEDTSKISNDIKEVGEFKQEIKHLKKKIDYDRDESAFINMIECQNCIVRCDKRMQELSTTALPVGYLLIVRKTFDELLEKVKETSTFTIERTIVGSPPKEIFPSSEHTRKKSYCSKKDKTFLVNDEGVNCNLYGSCILPNGTILLTDKHNHTLIRLNRSMKVKEKCKLDESPFSVACINELEAVVTAKCNKIIFVAIAKKMSVQRTLTVNHISDGIAYSRGMLYVADGKSAIHVHCKQTGNLISSIVTTHVGLRMFSEIRHIAINPDGTRIYVADSKKGLVILNSDGRYVTTVQNHLFDEAVGVCVGKSGNVYVSGLKSMNIVQIEPINHDVSEVVRMKRTEYPQSVCVNESKKLLIVTLCSYNSFKVFELKH